MSKRYGVWERLWRSAFSPAAYREVAADGTGSLFGYLAVLIAIATVVSTIITHLQIGPVLDDVKPWLIGNVPEMRVTDGILSSDVDQPYIWEEEGFGFVLDTTGAVTALDPAYDQGVLLTRTELIYRQAPGRTERVALASVKDVVVDDVMLDGLIETIKRWVWIPAGLFMLISLWIGRLVHVLFWSLIGLAVSWVTKRPLPYRALFNIGIYALTVPMALELLAGALGMVGWWIGLVFQCVYAGYLGWGIFVQPLAAPEVSDAAA